LTGRHARALVVVAALAAAALVAAAAVASGPPPIHAGPMKGQVPPRGKAHGSSSPDLTYHGGLVMTGGAAVTPIFWGSGWSSDPQDKQGWLAKFYAGMSGSSYAGTNAEYTQAGGAHVGTAISVSTGVKDLSATPRRAPSTSAVLAEVAKVITSPAASGYYPVYTDIPRGHAGYCAWHSAGTIGGTTVQFAFFFNLDGDPGCDPRSSVTAYEQGVAALANVSGHELSEALTDPQLNAWYDGSGEENADKCAWTFGHAALAFGNGTQWKVQGNWSNAADASHSGYDGVGCVDGG
jgi:hypothetical protein